MEGYKPNVFLGYSIEHSCSTQGFVPHPERYSRAYIMAKHLQYVVDDDTSGWPREFYEAAAQELGIEFVLGAGDEKVFDRYGREIEGKDVLGEGIKNLGPLALPEFLYELSRSRVLVGVGRPAT
jgi:hypothetical protein